jgi:hypothetical protein
VAESQQTEATERDGREREGDALDHHQAARGQTGDDQGLIEQLQEHAGTEDRGDARRTTGEDRARHGDGGDGREQCGPIAVDTRIKDAAELRFTEVLATAEVGETSLNTPRTYRSTS